MLHAIKGMSIFSKTTLKCDLNCMNASDMIWARCLAGCLMPLVSNTEIYLS